MIEWIPRVWRDLAWRVFCFCAATYPASAGWLLAGYRDPALWAWVLSGAAGQLCFGGHPPAWLLPPEEARDAQGKGSGGR